MRRADHVKRCGSMLQKGLYARNVKKLVLDNVSIEGCEGEEIELHNVDEVER